jgi:membrane protease YdiL (CAAX protease family)
MVRPLDDLKSALVLSGAFAVAVASAVPLLLSTLPPQARSLPLPMGVFCILLVVQLVVVYGLIGWAGLRLARFRGLEPAPVLTVVWVGKADFHAQVRPAAPVVVGVGCGILLTAAVAAIRRFFPGTLPDVLHPGGFAPALVASVAGAFGEEILFRLFLLSLLLRALPRGSLGSAIAVGLSALAFAAAHAPAMLTLFGGWHAVPVISWIWLAGLNGLCGVWFGIVFLRRGIEAAVVAHLVTDAIWHVVSRAVVA